MYGLCEPQKLRTAVSSNLSPLSTSFRPSIFFVAGCTLSVVVTTMHHRDTGAAKVLWKRLRASQQTAAFNRSTPSSEDTRTALALVDGGEEGTKKPTHQLPDLTCPTTKYGSPRAPLRSASVSGPRSTARPKADGRLQGSSCPPLGCGLRCLIAVAEAPTQSRGKEIASDKLCITESVPELCNVRPTWRTDCPGRCALPGMRRSLCVSGVNYIYLPGALALLQTSALPPCLP